MESLSDIINQISKEIGLERGEKIVTLTNLWPQIVGPRFKNSSKIFSVQENCGFDIIIVAVSSSAVLQELVFHKADIIKKIYKTAKTLELKIKDIQFSTKFWKEENEN